MNKSIISLVTLSTVALFSLPAFAENANMPSTQPSTQPYHGRIINDCNTCDSTGQYCTQIVCPEPSRSSRRNINHRRHRNVKKDNINVIDPCFPRSF